MRGVDLRVPRLDSQLLHYCIASRSVQYEVEEDLFDLARIGLHGAQPAAASIVSRMSSPISLSRIGRPGHDLVEVDHARLEDLAPAESEELAREGCRAVRPPA
jgi:hypothetical protein